MQNACEAVRGGMSMQKAAQAYGVPYSCLQRRNLLIIHAKPIKKRGGQPLFNDDQEGELTQRILKLSKCGFGLTRTDIRRAAYDFAVANGMSHKFSTKRRMAGKDFF